MSNKYKIVWRNGYDAPRAITFRRNSQESALAKYEEFRQGTLAVDPDARQFKLIKNDTEELIMED